MKELIFDLEFVGDPRKGGRALCCGWQWGVDGEVHCSEVIPDEVLKAVADPNVITVCHSKADWRWFREAGLEVEGPLHDTMVMAWTVNENTPLSLSYCAKRYCNTVMDKQLRQSQGEVYLDASDGQSYLLSDLSYDIHSEVSPEGEDADLLFCEVCLQAGSAKAGKAEGCCAVRQRLSLSIPPGTSVLEQTWSGGRASASGRKETPAVLALGRGSASRQRDSRRQSTRESMRTALGHSAGNASRPCLCLLRDELKEYNRRDVAATAKLYYTLKQKMIDTAWWEYYLDEQVPFTSVLLDMEMNGIPIDLGKVETLRQELEPRLEDQEQTLTDILGYRINFGSGDQLRSVLFEKVWFEKDSIPHGRDLRKPTLVSDIAENSKVFVTDKPRTKASVTDDEVEELKSGVVRSVTPAGFTVQKVTPKNLVGYWTRKGYGLPETPPTEKSVENGNPKPTTAISTLLATFPDHPFVVELSQWSKIRKVITTYLRNYPKYTHRGYLYGTFSQTGTKTGRISSARPNLMNQPAHGELGQKVRELFVGRLIVGDYGQLEPRLMADFSQDPVLLQAYTEGIDVYALTAAGIFGGSYRDYDEKHPKRKLSKQLFLGDQYGAGFKKLTMLLRLNGFPLEFDEVKRFQSKMHATYGVLMAWKEDVIREAHRKGYVETLDGHRRRLAVSLQDRSWKNRGYGERQAVNARVQGSAGDVVRRCMIAAADEFPNLPQLAQVHDEVLWEVPDYISQMAAEGILPELREVMEQGHGFDLGVPLVFEPGICRNWSEKGLKDIQWFDDEETDE